MNRFLFLAATMMLVLAACGEGDTTNVYTESPTPSPSGSPTGSPTPAGGNPYSGVWNNWEMKQTANGSPSQFGQFEVDGAGDFGIGLLFGTEDVIYGTVTAAGIVSGTFQLEGSTCAIAGTCPSASFCFGTITPACSGSAWDQFAMDRNQ